MQLAKTSLRTAQLIFGEHILIAQLVDASVCGIVGRVAPVGE